MFLTTTSEGACQWKDLNLVHTTLFKWHKTVLQLPLQHEPIHTKDKGGKHVPVFVGLLLQLAHHLLHISLQSLVGHWMRMCSLNFAIGFELGVNNVFDGPVTLLHTLDEDTGFLLTATLNIGSKL